MAAAGFEPNDLCPPPKSRSCEKGEIQTNEYTYAHAGNIQEMCIHLMGQATEPAIPNGGATESSMS